MRLILEDGTEVKLCNELEEQLNKAINVAKEESKDTGFFNGEYGKKCWIIMCDGNVVSDYESSEDTRKNINEFTSEEFAEKIRNKQLLERKMMKFSLEHDGGKIDRNDYLQDKCIIGYDYVIGNFNIVPVANVSRFGCPSFYSEEIARQAIKEFHDDLIKYFTEWKIL